MLPSRSTAYNQRFWVVLDNSPTVSHRFCDCALLSHHHMFGLHGGVWGVDCAPRQAYNGSVIMHPASADHGHGATLPENPANISWVCAILGERNKRWRPGQPLRHTACTGLVSASMICWCSQGHRCPPAGDSTPMMPAPAFIENGTDPISLSGRNGMCITGEAPMSIRVDFFSSLHAPTPYGRGVAQRMKEARSGDDTP